jgi:hypothetical protein
MVLTNHIQIRVMVLAKQVQIRVMVLEIYTTRRIKAESVE